MMHVCAAAESTGVFKRCKKKNYDRWSVVNAFWGHRLCAQLSVLSFVTEKIFKKKQNKTETAKRQNRKRERENSKKKERLPFVFILKACAFAIDVKLS